jgi:protease I
MIARSFDARLSKDRLGMPARPAPQPSMKDKNMKLQGKNIAILIAPRGTEEPEFVQPKKAVEEAGAKVTVVSLEEGSAQTFNNDLDPGGKYAIDKTVAEVKAESFDGLLVPGGCVGADKLRGSQEAVDFVRSFFQQNKPVGLICHAPWILIEADVLKGRTVTSYPSLQTDVKNASGTWVDKQVVVDQGLVTSRNPRDLPAFCAKVIEEFSEGRHDAQSRSVA